MILYRAEEYFSKSMRIFTDMGAASGLGEAYLGLGRLRKLAGRPDEAREYFEKATECFERADSRAFLEQTRELLSSLPETS